MKKMTVEERRRRRFTESFRKDQVALIESDKVTIQEVSKLYEVKVASIRRWLDKYGKKKRAPQIIISSNNDYNRLRILEKENGKLKELIGDQHVKMVYLEHLLELAKGQLGSDFEKKLESCY